MSFLYFILKTSYRRESQIPTWPTGNISILCVRIQTVLSIACLRSEVQISIKSGFSSSQTSRPLIDKAWILIGGGVIVSCHFCDAHMYITKCINHTAESCINVPSMESLARVGCFGNPTSRWRHAWISFHLKTWIFLVYKWLVNIPCIHI